MDEIKEIRWSGKSLSSTTGRQGMGVGRRRGDEVQIYFSNGDVLEFGVNEYSNFDEMRIWFLNFGKERGLLRGAVIPQ